MNKTWKTTLKSAFIVLLLFSLPGCARQAQPAVTPTTTNTGCTSATWTVLKTLDFGQPTLSVMFQDQSFGISTDLGGGIHYTEDGGETWTYSATSGLSRVALDINGDTIWHVGFGGELTRSSDAARTWELLSSLPHSGHIEYLSFGDELTGWSVSTELNVIFVTRDGGRTWERLPFPDGMGRPASLNLRTPSDGYLLDVAGNLFVTADGGQTWEKRSLGLEEGWSIPVLNHSAAMRFTDEKHGRVALNLIKAGASGQVFALRTEDGGLTWNQEPLPVSMGMFHLTRDGVYLTHVDLIAQGKITLLCRAAK